MTPQLVIDEGVPTTIGSITFGGSTDPANADLWAVVQARPGQPYYGPQIREDRDAVRLLYLNDGYETTSVNVDVQPSTDRRTVDLVFTIREGPQVIVDHILIVDNRQIKASTIRREIVLQEGGRSVWRRSSKRDAASPHWGYFDGSTSGSSVMAAATVAMSLL